MSDQNHQHFYIYGRCQCGQVQPNYKAQSELSATPCSAHSWTTETLYEKRFHVAWGAIRKCTKCGLKQFADYTEGRIGGPWRDIK